MIGEGQIANVLVGLSRKSELQPRQTLCEGDHYSPKDIVFRSVSTNLTGIRFKDQ